MSINPKIAINPQKSIDFNRIFSIPSPSILGEEILKILDEQIFLICF